ncbi:MAG: metallophosphoesterase family protein [Acidobacteriota bacterium]
MRLAVLADIHANVFALDAVLDDLAGRPIDQIVDLGDVVYGPIAPKATLERLATIEHLTIRGNQDRAVADATDDDLATNPTMAFVHADLETGDLAALGALPTEQQLDEAIFLCHGSPTSDVEYLLEDLGTDGHPHVADDATILDRLAGRRSELILCGHTHVPRVVRLSTGQTVVNPGSVGLPAYADDQPVPHVMQTFSPDASYALVERIDTGWRVEHVRVPYDHRRAAEACRRNGRDDWADNVATGRAG